MTVKLYYQDINQIMAKGNVVSSIEKDGKYHIILDQTIFFPENGGQLCDKGVINDNVVEYVYEENNEVIHVLNNNLSGHVDMSIDVVHRYLGMQGHTAQHLISAMVRKYCNGITFSHHYGEIFSTIDVDNFDESLTQEIQTQCNKLIRDNSKVNIMYPTNEELANMPIHKKFAVEGQIRIVNIEDVEYNPCAGLHCKSLGELQALYIQGYQKIKNGYRISFISGDKLIKDYGIKDNILMRSGELLSKPVYDVDAGLNNLLEMKKGLELEIYQLKDQLMNYKLQELEYEEINGFKYFNRIYTDMSVKTAANFVNKITTNGLVGVIGIQLETVNHLYVISRDSRIKANEIFKEIANNYEIRGGGNDKTAQGGSQTDLPFAKIIDEVRIRIGEI